MIKWIWTQIQHKIIDQFHGKKITPMKFYSKLLNKIHPFHDGNRKTSNILFAKDDEIIGLIDETKKAKD